MSFPLCFLLNDEQFSLVPDASVIDWDCNRMLLPLAVDRRRRVIILPVVYVLRRMEESGPGLHFTSLCRSAFLRKPFVIENSIHQLGAVPKLVPVYSIV